MPQNVNRGTKHTQECTTRSRKKFFFQWPCHKGPLELNGSSNLFFQKEIAKLFFLNGQPITPPRLNFTNHDHLKLKLFSASLPFSKFLEQRVQLWYEVGFESDIILEDEGHVMLLSHYILEYNFELMFSVSDHYVSSSSRPLSQTIF